MTLPDLPADQVAALTEEAREARKAAREGFLVAWQLNYVADGHIGAKIDRMAAGSSRHAFICSII